VLREPIPRLPLHSPQHKNSNQNGLAPHVHNGLRRIARNGPLLLRLNGIGCHNAEYR